MTVWGVQGEGDRDRIKGGGRRESGNGVIGLYEEGRRGRGGGRACRDMWGKGGKGGGERKGGKGFVGLCRGRENGTTVVRT